jgi:hypothetical protein
MYSYTPTHNVDLAENGPVTGHFGNLAHGKCFKEQTLPKIKVAFNQSLESFISQFPNVGNSMK